MPVNQLPPLGDAPLPWSLSNWWAPLRRFGRVIRDVKPDLVHAGPVQTGGFLAALWRCHPLLVMSWGSDVLTVPARNPWLRWISRFTLRAADMVLGDCRAVRDHVMALAWQPADRIVCFPWGVDPAQFRPRPPTGGVRASLHWEQQRVIIATRSFEPIHAPLVLVEALAQVCAARPDVRAVLLGDGNLRPHVERCLRERGLEGKVHLAGHVPHPLLPDYFNEADLYVSATLSDGTSISLLEAMACGLPVVVTDGYGNREWVTPGTNGWLYPAGNARALAAVLTEALDGERTWRTMGQANRALVCEQADWDHNFKRLLAAYDRLLSIG